MDQNGQNQQGTNMPNTSPVTPQQPQQAGFGQPVDPTSPQQSYPSQIQPLAPEQPMQQPPPPPTQTTQEPPQQPANIKEGSGHKKMAIVLIILLVVAALGISVAGFLLFGDKLGSSQSKTAATPTPVPEAPVQDNQQTPDPTLQAVQASIRTKAYNVLIEFLSSTVLVSIEASECCGKMSVAETINQMAYLNDATPPWDFDQNGEIIQQVKAAQATLKNYTLGVSQNNYVFGYTTNQSGKIDSVYMAADYSLLLPVGETVGPELGEEASESTSSATPTPTL